MASASQKTISQETVETRLRTGTLLETQDLTDGSVNIDVDTLLQGPTFDTPTQIVGFTSGNTMEVDANSLAAHMTLMPDEINYPLGGFSVGRYAWAASNFSYLSIGSAIATSNSIVLEFGWLNVAGICVVKKVVAWLAIGASTNTAAGTAHLDMYRAFGLGPQMDASNVNFPPPMGGNSVGGRSPATVGSTGQKALQPPSQARINGGIFDASRAAGHRENAYLDMNPVGSVVGQWKSGAGQSVFQNAPLFDYKVAEQPLILVPGTGFEVLMSAPTTSSGSSTTFHVFFNLQWDEWTLSAPGTTAT